MRVTREGHLLQLTWMPKFFPVNCYLVEEENELTLIDAGLSISLQGIVRTAAGLGKEITRIILTHAHADHVGALDKLLKVYPQAELYISERDAALLRGDRTLRKGEPSTPIRGSVPKKVAAKPDVLLQEGDMIGSLRAISTPGHTPGSMSYLDRRSQAVIAGDALQTFRGTAISGTIVPWFPFPALATWNKDEALSSAVKLLEAGPALLAAGHGDMLKDPHRQLQAAIHTAENKGVKRTL